MSEWQNRSLDEGSRIDVIVVKIRAGRVANQPPYAAIAVTLDGEEDVLGL